MNKHINWNSKINQQYHKSETAAKMFVQKNPWGLRVPHNQMHVSKSIYRPNFFYVVATVVLTPAMAELMFNSYNEKNRRFRQDKANGLVKTMIDLLWKECVGGMVVDDMFMFFEGQHRLWAIWQSGIPQQFTMYFGMPKDICSGLEAIPRTMRDALDMGNLVANRRHTNDIVRCVRRVYDTEHSSAAQSVLIDYYLNNVAPINFVVERFFPVPPKGQRNTGIYVRQPKVMAGPVLAAIVRAWHYYDDKAKLERFIEVLLLRRNAGPDESAATALHIWLAKHPLGGSKNGKIAMLMTEQAIKDFMCGHSVLHATPQSVDLFPRPDQDPAVGINNGLTNHDIQWFHSNYPPSP